LTARQCAEPVGEVRLECACSPPRDLDRALYGEPQQILAIDIGTRFSDHGILDYRNYSEDVIEDQSDISCH
jgi:hypothetical protein